MREENNKFEFNKREKRGYAVITLLTLLLFILPRTFQFFAKNPTQKISSAELTALQKQVALDTSKTATSNRFATAKDFSKGDFRDFNPSDMAYDKSLKGELFDFDPNTIDAAAWARLGLSDKTITTIVKYREKGGKFFQPEDIGRIYGLSDSWIERLLPFVKIAKQNKSTTYSNNDLAKQTDKQLDNKIIYTSSTKQNSAATYEIDINAADTTAWKKLPGIGSKLSARIVNYREKLGGFHSISQVGETFGLQDSVFQKIKTQLLVSTGNIQLINVNTATLEQLNAHPYINKSFANNIIQYRNQHGNYSSENDLKKLALFKEEVWQKIKPYIIF